MNKSIIGVGIDQGLANLGYAIVELTPNEEIVVHTFGTLKTKSSETLQSRLLTIYEFINKLIVEYNGNIVACEKLFFNPKQKTGRNKSASIMHTNMVTGVVFLSSEINSLPIKDFVPGTVKKYVAGSGRAKKEEVEECVNKSISSDIEIKTEHESDAIAIGITVVKYYKENLKDGVFAEPVKEKKTKAKTTKTKAIKTTKNSKKKGDEKLEK